MVGMTQSVGTTLVGLAGAANPDSTALLDARRLCFCCVRTSLAALANPTMLVQNADPPEIMKPKTHHGRLLDGPVAILPEYQGVPSAISTAVMRLAIIVIPTTARRRTLSAVYSLT